MTLFTKTLTAFIFGDGSYATAETKTYADLESYTYEGFGALHSGALTGLTSKSLSGSIGPSGSIIRGAGKVLLARLPISDEFIHRISKAFSGVISFVGVLGYKTNGNLIVVVTEVPTPVGAFGSVLTPYASSITCTSQPYASRLWRAT